LNEDYYSWEDETRFTFIELSEIMDNDSNPLDYLIRLCETAVNTGKWNLTKFTILNAKDELKKLRESKKDLAHDAFQANQNAVEDTNRWLSCEQELVAIKEKINLIFSKPVAYGLINEKYDLYNLSLCYNQYEDQSKLIPLYSNKEEFLKGAWKNGKLSQ
jgi:hypothetical protein